jgi:zinc/manganese transport system substrate-binding protein
VLRFSSFIRLLVFGGFVALLFPATVAAQARPQVVATFSILADVVQNVGGSQIDLVTLVGANGDTHEYEPVPSDALTLRRADLIFEEGFGFESWLDRLYSASGSQAQRVEVTRDVTPFVHPGDNGAVETDPHAWGDVQNVVKMTWVIVEALSQRDPSNAPLYAGNGAAYVAQLNDLDAWVVGQFSLVPADRRQIFSNHDALGYLARRYGLTTAGNVVDSFSTEAQPSAQRFAQLVRDLRASGARVIFIENVANPTLAQQAARSAGATVAPELFTDALGDQDSPATTYISMITYNVTTIVAALSA